jgi:hypothetical protein
MKDDIVSMVPFRGVFANLRVAKGCNRRVTIPEIPSWSSWVIGDGYE